MVMSTVRGTVFHCVSTLPIIYLNYGDVFPGINWGSIISWLHFAHYTEYPHQKYVIMTISLNGRQTKLNEEKIHSNRKKHTESQSLWVMLLSTCLPMRVCDWFFKLFTRYSHGAHYRTLEKMAANHFSLNEIESHTVLTLINTIQSKRAHCTQQEWDESRQKDTHSHHSIPYEKGKKRQFVRLLRVNTTNKCSYKSWFHDILLAFMSSQLQYYFAR